MARTKCFDEDEVLEKAMGVFWRKGYGGTSMEELVHAMGINRASMYDTYGDKHSLFLSALQHYRTRFMSAVIGATRRPGRASDVIRDILLSLEQTAQSDKNDRGCFVVNSMVELGPHDPEIALVVKENQMQLEAAFEALVRRGQEEGDISSGAPPRSLARFIVSTLQGLALQGKIKSNRGSMHEIIEVALRALK